VLVVTSEVVFTPVPTVFHGLKVGFGKFFWFWVALAITTAVVVFVAVTVAAEASSLSLLVVVVSVLVGAIVVFCFCLLDVGLLAPVVLVVSACALLLVLLVG